MVERPTLLTEAEAAVYIGMSPAYLRMDRCRGHVGNRTPGPAWMKLGRAVRYDMRDLNAWLADRRVDRGDRRASNLPVSSSSTIRRPQNTTRTDRSRRRTA